MKKKLCKVTFAYNQSYQVMYYKLHQSNCATAELLGTGKVQETLDTIQEKKEHAITSTKK